MTDQRFENLAEHEFEIAFTRLRCMADAKPPRPKQVVATATGLRRAMLPSVHRPEAEIDRALRKQREADADAWSHKEGTPQTHARAEHSTALGRLFLSGIIDRDQLAAAEQINAVHEMIERDVGIRVVSYEPRIDCSASGRDALLEGIVMVRREMAYGWWRERLRSPRRAILDMIVGEPTAFSTVARRHRIGKNRAKNLLIHSLNLWGEALDWAAKQVDEADLAAAHAGLL